MTHTISCLLHQHHSMCPLLIATVQGDLPIARLCIQSPLVDLNIANSEGKTALILAIEREDTAILDALLCCEDATERLSIDHIDVN